MTFDYLMYRELATDRFDDVSDNMKVKDYTHMTHQLNCTDSVNEDQQLYCCLLSSYQEKVE